MGLGSRRCTQKRVHHVARDQKGRSGQQQKLACRLGEDTSRAIEEGVRV